MENTIIKISNNIVGVLVIRALNEKGIKVVNPQSKVRKPCILVNKGLAVLISNESLSVEFKEVTDLDFLDSVLLTKPAIRYTETVKAKNNALKELKYQVAIANSRGYEVRDVANGIGIGYQHLRNILDGRIVLTERTVRNKVLDVKQLIK